MRTKSTLTLSGVVGAVVAALVLSAGPASADPPLPPLAGTGSDTTQFVLDGLSSSIRDTSSDRIIGSYDAVDPATGLPGGLIQTRHNGVLFDRPNGSGGGLRALTASINPTGTLTWPQTKNGATTQVDITGQLDFARSSNGPSAGNPDLTYIPFAQDAVSYAFVSTASGAVPSNIPVGTPGNTTEISLRNIYLGNVTTYPGGTFHPLLPQSGSGTRAFFLAQLGLVEADVSGIPSTVGGTSVQENSGALITTAGQIVPFSVASWIAQNNNVVPNTIRSGGVTTDDVVLGSVNGVAPIVSGALNTSFPLNRLVYNVVATSRVTGSAPGDALLQQTFVGGFSRVCSSSTVIRSFGFGTISNCGVTTITGPFVL